MDAAQEVKARLNIEDVISQYIQLKRSGRNFKGISPWTKEKTPSFMVSPEKQIWHDFSSGKGGDIFTFVMEMEGLDFRGALDQLARQAGVDLEEFSPQQNAGRSQLKSRVLEILELSTKFYQRQLAANQSALKYLITDRGFNKQTLLTWRLGYAPHTATALTTFLTKKGFATDEMKAAGIAVVRANGPLDMFRGRIMIPLADSRGAIIGFTARLLADPLTSSGQVSADAPKYINTPQTIVYDKSRHVYGLHLAKESVRKDTFVVIVEGNLDVIASHQAGVQNVVATAGTAITDKQLKELKRFTGDIRLCFDADTAGLTATERAIALAQQVGVELGVISLGDEAKDADELVRKDPKKWQAAVNKSQYALDWLIDRYKSQLDLASAQGKKAFTDAILVTVRRLKDPVEQEHYLKILAKISDVTLETIRAKFSQNPSVATRLRQPKIQSGNFDRGLVEYQKLQDNLLAMTLVQPKLRDLLYNCRIEYFSAGPPRQVFEFLKTHPNFRGEPQLAKELQEASDYVKILILQFEELYQDLPPEDLREQAIRLKHRLIVRYAKTQKQQLADAMKGTQDQEKLQQLMRKVNKLNELIKSN